MEINYLSLLVSVVGAIVIGTIWFGPLFGEIFIKGLGFKSMKEARAKFDKNPKGKQQMIMTYGVQTLSSLLTACFMSAIANINMSLAVAFLVTSALAEYATTRWAGKSLKFATVDIGGMLVTRLYFLLVYCLLGAQFNLG